MIDHIIIKYIFFTNTFVIIFSTVYLKIVFYVFANVYVCFLYRYMKYLYDYECEKKNLSTRSELDAAIEGNKREGRRASGQYDAQAALAMVSKVMIRTCFGLYNW